jgi:hypothetical protein
MSFYVSLNSINRLLEAFRLLGGEYVNIPFPSLSLSSLSLSSV